MVIQGLFAWVFFCLEKTFGNVLFKGTIEGGDDVESGVYLLVQVVYAVAPDRGVGGDSQFAER